MLIHIKCYRPACIMAMSESKAGSVFGIMWLLVPKQKAGLPPLAQKVLDFSLALFELGRTHHPKRRVSATPVVENFYVVEDIGTSPVPG